MWRSLDRLATCKDEWQSFDQLNASMALADTVIRRFGVFYGENTIGHTRGGASDAGHGAVRVRGACIPKGHDEQNQLKWVMSAVRRYSPLRFAKVACDPSAG